MNVQSCSAFLNEELERRKKDNPRYSLRKFALDIGISASVLSDALNGRRGLGLRAAVKVADCCGLVGKRRSEFLSLSVGVKHLKFLDSPKDTDFRELAPEEHASLCTLKHYGVLGLAALPRSSSDPAWIAKRLDISEEDAIQTRDELLRMGMIKIDGKWMRENTGSTRTRTDYPSDVIRALHRQIMEKAALSLEKVPLSERDITAVTLPVNSHRLRAAKKKITSFRRNLMSYLSEGEKDEVYAMQISLFPLTHLEASHDSRDA